MPKKNVDRRVFLKGAALAALAPVAQAADTRRTGRSGCAQVG